MSETKEETLPCSAELPPTLVEGEASTLAKGEASTLAEGCAVEVNEESSYSSEEDESRMMPAENQVPLTKSQKKRMKKKNQKLKKTMEEAAREQEAAEKKRLIAEAIAAKSSRRTKKEIKINPETGKKMDARYYKDLAKQMRNDTAPYVKMFKELGVEQEVIPHLAEQVRLSVQSGKIKDNVELTKNVVSMLQDKNIGAKIPTIPGTTAHQLQMAAKDPNFAGFKVGTGPEQPPAV